MSTHVEALLRQAAPLLAIAEAYDAVASVAILSRREPEVTFHYGIDTSDLTELVVPSSLRVATSQFPTIRDIAILYLFQYGPKPLYLHPLYINELEVVRNNWKRRLIDQESALLAQERAVEQAWIEHRESPVTLVKRFLHKLLTIRFRRSDEFLNYRRSIEEGPISLLTHSVLQLSETLPLDEGQVRLWANFLDQVEPSPNRQFANQIDAHVLSSVEEINRSLPKNQFFILISHSRKLYRAVTLRELSASRRFAKRGISLLQPPEVSLVRVHNLGDATSHGSVDDNALATLVELRDEFVAHRRLFRAIQSLRPQADENGARGQLAEALARVSDRVSDFQANLIEWANLSIASRGDGSKGSVEHRVQQVLRVISPGDHRDDLRREAERSLTQLRESQAAVWYSLPPVSIEFSYDRALHTIVPARRLLAGYTYSFMSGQLQKHVSELGRRIVDGQVAELDLQFHQARTYSKRVADPDEWLFMAFLCGLAAAWPQALDAAKRGLKALGCDVDHARFHLLSNNRRSSQACELSVAYIFALRQWSMSNHLTKPFVSSHLRRALAFANRFKEHCSQANLPDDARMAREVSVIFLVAYDNGIDLELNPGVDVLHEGEKFASKALDLSEQADMILYCSNNLLYALAQRNDKATVPKRQRLATTLSESEDSSEPHFLDTRSWHHCQLAKLDIEREKNLKLAIELNDLALRLVNTNGGDGGYVEALLMTHRAEIESLRKQPG